MSDADAVLEKGWPDRCDDFWMRQCRDSSTALGWYSGERSRYLPLLQSEHLVQCEACKRTVVTESFVQHQVLSRGLTLLQRTKHDKIQKQTESLGLTLNPNYRP